MEAGPSLHPGRYRWPSNSGDGEARASLFNFKTVQIYKLLIQKQKKKGREMFVPRWRLPVDVQKMVIKFLWESRGIRPKVKYNIWVGFQAALPNGDRTDKHLADRGHQFCSFCPGQEKQKTEHIDFLCDLARFIWTALDRWLNRLFPGRGLSISQEVALFRINVSRKQKFLNKQWWPILWASTLYVLWTHWTSVVYGSKSAKDPNKLFCLIWDAVITDGQALRQSLGAKFQKRQWMDAGFFVDRYLTTL